MFRELAIKNWKIPTPHHLNASQGGGDFYAGGAYNRTYFCCCFQVDGPIKKGALLDGARGGFKAAVYFVTLCRLYV